MDSSNDLCMICGHDDNQAYLQVPDRSSLGRWCQVVRCRNCGTLRLAEGSAEKPATSAAFDPHHAMVRKRNLTELACHLAGPVTQFFKGRSLAAHLPTKGPVLEVGCGTGEMAANLSRRGLDVVGVEPETSARHYARQHHGLHVVADVDQAPTGFSSAVLWHVLEHVEAPVTFLDEVRSKLNAAGLLVVAVPNAASHDAAMYGADWVAWDAPRHLWHFEPETLERVISDAGFDHMTQTWVPSDTLFNCTASELLSASRSRWTLPLRLTRALWRTAQILLATGRFGPERASTLLVVAKVKTS